jgi:uncharacterized membrane protein YqhA
MLPIILYLDEQTGQTHVIPHKLFFPTVERVEILLVSILLFFFFLGQYETRIRGKETKRGRKIGRINQSWVAFS